MNKKYVIAFISYDKDIILEPLAKFNGDVMYFKSSHDARDYIEKLYVNSGVDAVEYDDDGLEIIRVQQGDQSPCNKEKQMAQTELDVLRRNVKELQMQLRDAHIRIKHLQEIKWAERANENPDALHIKGDKDE